MPAITQFRAALHGYNREDVVNFIDSLTREQQDNLRRLQEQNEELQSQLDEARQNQAQTEQNQEREKALAEAQALTAELQARNEELEARSKELEAQLQDLKEQLSAAQAERKEAPVEENVPQDLNEPIPPLSEVLPEQEAPAKDYAELELAAYRRAELTERLARERAGDVYRQVQSVFNQASEKLDADKADLRQLSQTLTANVNEMLSLLTHIHSAYDQAETIFGEIGARNLEILEEEI